MIYEKLYKMYINSNVASHARDKRYNYYACFVSSSI